MWMAECRGRSGESGGGKQINCTYLLQGPQNSNLVSRTTEDCGVWWNVELWLDKASFRGGWNWLLECQGLDHQDALYADTLLKNLVFCLHGGNLGQYVTSTNVKTLIYVTLIGLHRKHKLYSATSDRYLSICICRPALVSCIFLVSLKNWRYIVQYFWRELLKRDFRNLFSCLEDDRV